MAQLKMVARESLYRQYLFLHRPEYSFGVVKTFSQQRRNPDLKLLRVQKCLSSREFFSRTGLKMESLS